MDVMSRPDRAVFRLPAVALFLPILLFFCITPLATAGPWWGVLFAVPAGALVWVLIARTTATPTGVTAHGLLGSKKMAWSDMDGLEFRDSRWAIAVGTDGRRLRLPMVRPRDLPALTAVSGGSLLLGADAQVGTADPDSAVGGAAGRDTGVADHDEAEPAAVSGDSGQPRPTEGASADAPESLPDFRSGDAAPQPVPPRS